MLPTTSPLPDVLALADEVRLTYNAMVRLGELVHRGRGVTLAMRAVLEYLDRAGPATVPAIARARGVSRQHIQVIVNDLVEAGLVELSDNPSHRRSRVVGLTPIGRATIGDITRREAEILQPATADLEGHDMELAIATLVRLRHRLDDLTQDME